MDTLHCHCVRALRKVGLAACPFNHTDVIVLGVTGSPYTQAHVHGCLGVTGATLCFRGSQLANLLAIDPPLDAILGPVDGVVVEVVLRDKAEVEVFATVIRGDVALALQSPH